MQLAELSAAVHALFYCNDPEQKRQANAWLTAWRTHGAAWATCRAVLRDPAAAPELRLLCAQTLHASARRPGALPAGASLEEEVQFLLETLPGSDRPAAAQLGLAVAALLLHAHPAVPLAATVGAVCGFFEPRPGPHLAAVLSCLPEQARSPAVGMPPAARDAVQRALADLGAPVLHALQRSEASSSSPSSCCWQCLRQWIGFAPIGPCPLLEAAVPALAGEAESADAAAELLTGVLTSTADTDVAAAADLLCAQVGALRQLLAAAQRHGEQGAFRRVSGVVAAVVLAGRTTPEMLEALLEATDCAWMAAMQDTFEAWHTLAKSQAEALEPVVDRLVAVLVRRTEYPAEYTTWDEDRRDEFGELRRYERDLLRVVASRRGQPSEAQALGLFMQALQDAAAVQAWQRIESLLHSLSSISKPIPVTESVCIPQLLPWLEQLPSTPLLDGAAVVLVGVVAHWLSQNPAHLSAALRTVGRSLRHSETDATYPLITKRTATEHAGCVSFQKLCNACGPAMAAGHLSDVGALYASLRQAVEAGRATPKSQALFLQGLGTLVGCLSFGTTETFLSELCSPLFQSTATLATDQPSPDAVGALEQLAVLFATCGPPKS
eukprot:EG_transcript_7038